MKTTSYLPAEELLARYPGRLASINCALAACYLKMGLVVPDRLINPLAKVKHESSLEGQEDL